MLDLSRRSQWHISRRPRNPQHNQTGDVSHVTRINNQIQNGTKENCELTLVKITESGHLGVEWNRFADARRYPPLKRGGLPILCRPPPSEIRVAKPALSVACKPTAHPKVSYDFSPLNFSIGNISSGFAFTYVLKITIKVV